MFSIYTSTPGNKKICHLITSELLHKELKQANHAYVAKLKAITHISIVNTSEAPLIELDSLQNLWECLDTLHDYGFENVVIWYEGTWMHDGDFDENLSDAIDEWGDDWFVAGHIIDRQGKYAKFHEQVIVVNLNNVKSLPKRLHKLNGFTPIEYTPSSQHMHDDYTPIMLTPGEDKMFDFNLKLSDVDVFLPLSINAGLKVHNLPYSVRNCKTCIYPEDDIDFMTQWLVDNVNYYEKDLPEDKQELYHLKNMTESVLYVTNTEGVPINQNNDITVMTCPCSGLHQFRHMINNLSTIKKVVWFDFNQYSIMWTKILLNEWDGVDFDSFWHNNKQRLFDAGFESEDNVIYDQDLMLEFMSEYTTDQWLEHWSIIRSLDHSFTQMNVVQEYKTLVEEIGTNENVLLQLSNIWSYEINYINSSNINAYSNFVSLCNDVVTNNNEVYLYGDVLGKFYDLTCLSRQYKV